MDEWILPEIDQERCVRCGLCVELCPTQAVEMTGQGPAFSEGQACTYCGVCEAGCAEGAISLSYVIVWDKARL
jgi:formate hydrogenlyase subunit 6/NADH:ubiquinone oxidoreductase subunit I